MKKLLVILAFFLLTLPGCGTIREYLVQKVEVPIPVPCIIVLPEKAPMPLTDSTGEEVDIFEVLKKALAEIQLRIAYETKLEAATKACNTAAPVVAGDGK